MTITILTHDPRWKGLRPTVERAVAAALAQQKIIRAAVTVVLADDAEIQALNKQYRGKNKPTNVLSFPDGSVDGGVRQLGDIVMAYETLAREAVAQGKPLKRHLTHLAVHGTLHLLGFDHEVEAEAEAMEACEIKILARMGIANPYESA
ncbi:MAG: rRNA maturation RNase YbeY [Pseudomonadota bacterium]